MAEEHAKKLDEYFVLMCQMDDFSLVEVMEILRIDFKWDELIYKVSSIRVPQSLSLLT